MKERMDNLGKARRKFLKQAGKVAVYTPPAFLAIAQPSLGEFVKSKNGTTGHDHKGPKRRDSDHRPTSQRDHEDWWKDERYTGSPNHSDRQHVNSGQRNDRTRR